MCIRDRFFLQLLERLGQSMGDAHIFAVELAHQLDIVVTRHAKRGFTLDHAHDKLQDFRSPWSTIDEIAQEYSLSCFRVARRNVPVLTGYMITKFCQEALQFVEASMDVSNYVEWTMLIFQIVPERLSPVSYTHLRAHE